MQVTIDTPRSFPTTDKSTKINSPLIFHKIFTFDKVDFYLFFFDKVDF